MANDNDAPVEDDDQPIWLQPVEAPEETGKDRHLASRILIAGVASLVLLLFVALIWFLYSRGEDAGEPVHVRAPDTPVKVEPADRGGLEVPHQDKLVFNRVSGEPSPSTETLRESAEQPLARPEVPEISASLPEAGEVAGAGPDAAPAAADSPSVAPGWKVQIAAFQQKRDADTWMISTKYKHPEIFDGLEGAVVTAKKDMATYFRVRFGPLADEAAARRKCDEIRKAKLNCLIVGPQ